MNTTGHFDISVIVPTYNRAELLVRAIHSIGSPRSRVEIVVVDDGSTDGTAQALENEFGPRLARDGPCAGNFPPFHLFSQPNRGAAAARNLGLDRASGDFVKFLDSDDVLVTGMLDRELEHARRTGADVVVSGWIEQIREEGPPREIAAPELERGIEDMLLGRSAWTAAALYRREAVRQLRWDPEHGKADDWGWVWRVCLSDATFSRLPVASAVYCCNPGARITRRGNPFLDSTRVRQRILREVEDALRSSGRLTPPRAQALAAYYLKDRMVLAERDPEAWRQLCAHVYELSPSFKAAEVHPWANPCVRCFGLRRGIQAYVALRRMARRAMRRPLLEGGSNEA